MSAPGSSRRELPAADGPSGRELTRAIARAGDLLRRQSLLVWSRAIRVEQGRPLDFDAFPFQRELYECFGDRRIPTVDVMKSAQCGISAAGVSLALYAAEAWGATVLYVLPTEEMAHQFSDTRVKTAIEASVMLRRRVVATDNKELKRIGDGYVYFVGSGSERRALSIPGDVLVLDEYDRLDQRHIQAFRKRLNAPDSLRLERRFSNPSFPESGIHERYLASDQRAWLVRCGRCGRERPLGFEASDDAHHVDAERAVRVCGRCRSEIGPEEVAGGRWVPRHPGRPPGFHISRLIVPAEDIAALAAEHARTDEASAQAHHNFDLGLPYAPRGGSLDRERVMACRRDYLMPTSWSEGGVITAGVDVGSVLHVRISRHLSNGKAVPLFLNTVTSFEELGQLMGRYDVTSCVIDERPEERKAREFADAFRGRVLLARWSGDDQRDPFVVDPDKALLVARRTGALDRTVEEFTAQQRLLPRDIPSEYVSQLTAPARMVETNARGQKVARYVSSRADHFFFAECYDILAKQSAPVPPAGASGQDPEPFGRGRIGRRSRIFGP